MARGGRRSTTWKPTWKHGKTRTIRVPIVLAESILNLARILDEGEAVSKDSLVTGNIKAAANSDNSHVTGNTEEKSSYVTDNKNELVEKLDPNDASASIEALTTAISLKQIAISKESKKRSKVDTTIIAKWHKEIESIERTGARSALRAAQFAYLKSI